MGFHNIVLLSIAGIVFVIWMIGAYWPTKSK